ncbi:MAG: FliH/SctL family protein [Actinomycetota bacterium]|nr:FliH/SctL family protein [Actinomycetota bacterium]
MSLSAELPRTAPKVLRGAAAASLRPAERLGITAPAALFDHVAPGEEAGDDLAAEAMRERAQAYDEGYAAGRAEAQASAEQARVVAIEQLAAALTSAAHQAATERAALVAEVSGDALTLCYELARTILGDDSFLAALAPQAMVARALELAPDGEDLIVRLAPNSALGPEELAELCDPARIAVREDASIEPGGCVVEVGSCRIDAQISTALERVRKVLAEAKGTPLGARP